MAKPRKYTIDEFKQAVAEARSLRDTLLRLGLNATGGNYLLAQTRIKSLGLSTEHWTRQGWAKGTSNPGKNARSIQDYLVKDSLDMISSDKLKKRLYREGLLAEICSKCGIKDWLGQSLALHLDHINGVHTDNRLENLRILCPNCHSQTNTYAGKNKHKYIRTKKLGSGLPSATESSVKDSPNLNVCLQDISIPVDP